MTLKFNEASHRYWLDGKPIPGVTTLIKGGLPAPALTYWAARTVAEWVADNEDDCERLRAMGRGPMVAALKETPWQARDEAAGRGTEVHALGEQLVVGAEVEVPDALAGHVESYVRFLDEWKPEPLLVELPVAHRTHWWAGRFDLIARMCGQTWLLDIKTTRSGIFGETALQLAAYSHAEFYSPDGEQEIPLPTIDRTAAIWVRADGYDLIPVDAGDSTYQLFRHVAHVGRHAKSVKDLVGEALPVPSDAQEGAA